ATPMPNVTPKEPQPDSWVQVEKAQPNFPEWTHVAGSCGIAHPIIRWERDAQGNVVPVCCACRDQAGFPACDPIRYMKQ
ncbi:MAG: hypothetical protein Q7R63_00765, partial [bacterium]|nr:hypothetical protein [bacterium]